MQTISVTQTRNYGKLEQSFSHSIGYDGDDSMMKDVYHACNRYIEWMFEDFETNILPKIQYRQAESIANPTNSREFDAISVVKEVKDGKEYVRIKTKPGTFYHKYGVAVYPECEGYDVLMTQLNGGYLKEWKPEQGARIVVLEGENKKVVKFTIQIPF